MPRHAVSDVWCSGHEHRCRLTGMTRSRSAVSLKPHQPCVPHNISHCTTGYTTVCIGKRWPPLSQDGASTCAPFRRCGDAHCGTEARHASTSLPLSAITSAEDTLTHNGAVQPGKRDRTGRQPDGANHCRARVHTPVPRALPDSASPPTQPDQAAPPATRRHGPLPTIAPSCGNGHKRRAGPLE